MSRSIVSVLPLLAGCYLITRSLWTGDPTDRTIALWGSLACMVLLSVGEIGVALLRRHYRRAGKRTEASASSAYQLLTASAPLHPPAPSFPSAPQDSNHGPPQ